MFKKVFKIILVLVLILLVSVLLVVKFKLNDIVQQAVEKMGPDMLGVPVTLAKVDIRPLQGKAALGGLVVGNPEGYQTPNAFELGEIKVKLDMGSLKTDIIRIEEILITEPSITYEKSLKKSNIAQLLEDIKGEEEEGADDAEAAPEDPAGDADAEGGKKVVIDRVLINGAEVNLSTAILMGKAVHLPLPKIEMTGIGESVAGDAEGTSIAAAVTQVLSEVLKGVTGVVAGAGGLAVDGVKAAGGLAVDGTQLVGEGVVGAGGAAVDGVKAVGDGAAKITKGLGGLLGGGKDKAAEQNEEEKPATEEEAP